LNAGKFIEGTPVIVNAIKPMLSDTSSDGTASASHFIVGYEAWKALDASASTTWVSGAVAGNVWLKFDFTVDKIINAYNITGATSGSDLPSYPKNWTFEGSSNGIDWVVLDTKINQPAWLSGEKKSFYFNNNIAYKQYRINISANHGGSHNAMLFSFEMYNDFETMFIRSLSGGVAYADANGLISNTDKSLGCFPTVNEWDKYIVKSTLNDKITAGDNNVWNWNGVFSWVAETIAIALGTNAMRVIRGNNSAIKFSWTASATSNSIHGFRPVLIFKEDGSIW
jgi:hypothetical protein